MFDTIKQGLSNLFSNPKLLIILILIAIFISVAVYVYNTYVIPRLYPDYVANNGFVPKHGSAHPVDDDKIADVYFFYTTWCPHCKKAKPEWEAFKNSVGDNKVNGWKIQFIEIDCDQDENTADKFKVDGYPTIKMVKGNQIIEYDAKPNKATLMEFLEKTL